MKYGEKKNNITLKVQTYRVLFDELWTRIQYSILI